METNNNNNNGVGGGGSVGSNLNSLLSSSTGSFGSLLSPIQSGLSGGNNSNNNNNNNSAEYDSKVQKIVANYQKIKGQNAILKKALVQEQQKTTDLEKELKEKSQALTTAIQEHDVLEFNNQRLTKRITLIQEANTEKKESGWGFGKSKVELQKKEEEINILKSELQEKIDDNESLHSVTTEKENAYKALDSQLRGVISEKDSLLVEKDLKIESLLIEQKESEKKLVDQTRGLRENIGLLEKSLKQVYITAKQRDDALQQLSQIFENGLSNQPPINFDYPIENITPSNERFSFDDIIFDKTFQDITLNSASFNSIADKNQWSQPYRAIIICVQNFISYHLDIISKLTSSHQSIVKSLNEKHQNEIIDLNENKSIITLQKEEIEFTLNSKTEELTLKEKEVLLLSQELLEKTQLLNQQLQTSRVIDEQIQNERAEYQKTKSQLEQQIITITNNFQDELKKAKDQHQGLLRHQKQLLNSKIEQQNSIILNLQKQLSSLSVLQPTNSNSGSSNSLIDLDTSNNSNNNSNSNNTSFLDLSFIEGQLNNININNNSNNNNNANTGGSSLLDFDEQQQQQQPPPATTATTIINSAEFNSTDSTSPKVQSERFKLTVLDDTGDQLESLNFSITDKEREKEMKIYYENKITQLLNKISNIDAKTVRYHDQYQQLLKKGSGNDNVKKEHEATLLELKNTKDELEVTRFNYDQQLRMMTEQFVSLNESISQLDSELLNIKQHKILCAKCKTWNPLEFIFSPENPNLYCSKGHPLQTLQIIKIPFKLFDFNPNTKKFAKKKSTDNLYGSVYKLKRNNLNWFEIGCKQLHVPIDRYNVYWKIQIKEYTKPLYFHCSITIDKEIYTFRQKVIERETILANIGEWRLFKTNIIAPPPNSIKGNTHMVVKCMLYNIDQFSTTRLSNIVIDYFQLVPIYEELPTTTTPPIVYIDTIPDFPSPSLYEPIDCQHFIPIEQDQDSALYQNQSKLLLQRCSERRKEMIVLFNKENYFSS
ncbi:hypothetical protein CYY_008222 [Polysphondylium violaceum]|uniref:Protein phosphatase 1 regulatory subunit 21 N-terminal domain-containing protein n=1 Tax=Polysphondylium violaceum TaxID=133409 RepID=A0A8J4V1G8_9MYCE|nr:hypothetical protein CYY_008222 [Polysphondylium violaceum]